MRQINLGRSATWPVVTRGTNLNCFLDARAHRLRHRFGLLVAVAPLWSARNRAQTLNDLRVKHSCCLMSSTRQAYMRWEPDSHAKAR
jgi:hypothetical protein